MPKQPTSKQTDPNRRRRTPDSAFKALTQGVQEETSQYFPEDPNLIRNNSTGGELRVGQQRSGPVGRSASSSLADILGGTIEAAAAGAEVYSVVTTAIEKKRKKADEELDRAQETALAEERLKADYISASPSGRLEKEITVLSQYTDQYGTARGKHNQNMRLLEGKLKGPDADQATFFQREVYQLVQNVTDGPFGDGPEGAKDIAEIFRKADEIAAEKFKDDPTRLLQVRSILSTGLSSAEGEFDARIALEFEEWEPIIDEAYKRGLGQIAQGRTFESPDAFSAWILEEIDFPAPVPYSDKGENEYSSVVLESLTDKLSKRLKVDFSRIQDTQDTQVQGRAERGYEAVLAEIGVGKNTGPGGLSAADMETLEAAGNVWRLALIKEPHTFLDKATDIIQDGIGVIATNLNYDMGEEDRRKFAKNWTEKMMTTWGIEKESNRGRIILANLESEEFDVLAKFLGDLNDQGAVGVGKWGSGSMAEAARKSMRENLMGRAADFGASVFALDFNRTATLQSHVNPFNLTPLTSLNATDREFVTTYVGVAILAAGRGEPFEEVLKDEFEKNERADVLLRALPNIVDIVMSGKAGALIEHARNMDIEGSSVVSFNNLVDTYVSLGGSFDANGTFTQIDPNPNVMRDQIGKENGLLAMHFNRKFSEANELPVNYTEITMFADDIRMFTEFVVSAPDLMGAFETLDYPGKTNFLKSLFMERYKRAPSPAMLDSLAQTLSDEGPNARDAFGENTSRFAKNYANLIRDAETRGGATSLGMPDGLDLVGNAPQEILLSYVNGGDPTMDGFNRALREFGLIQEPVGNEGKTRVAVDPDKDFRSPIFAINDDGSKVSKVNTHDGARPELTAWVNDIHKRADQDGNSVTAEQRVFALILTDLMDGKGRFITGGPTQNTESLEALANDLGDEYDLEDIKYMYIHLQDSVVQGGNIRQDSLSYVLTHLSNGSKIEMTFRDKSGKKISKHSDEDWASAHSPDQGVFGKEAVNDSRDAIHRTVEGNVRWTLGSDGQVAGSYIDSDYLTGVYEGLTPSAEQSSWVAPFVITGRY